MTLNAKIGSFYGFFGRFRAARHILRTNCAEINWDKHKKYTQFSALNIDFDGLSLDFLSSRKSAHEGIKERYPRKSRYFAIVGQSFVKTVADRQ